MFERSVRIKILFLLTFLGVLIVSTVLRGVFFETGFRNCGFLLTGFLQKEVFLGLSVALLVVILFLFNRKKTDMIESVCWALIFSGGFFNTYQRFYSGCVIDYIDFYFFKSNSSDLAISLGVLTLIYKLGIKPLMPRKLDGEGKGASNF